MNKKEETISKTNINWYPGHMAKTRQSKNNKKKKKNSSVK